MTTNGPELRSGYALPPFRAVALLCLTLIDALQASEMLVVVERLKAKLKLPINAGKTRCLRCPEEPFRVPRVPHGLELVMDEWEPVCRRPPVQGQRTRHLPQDQ